MRERGVVWGGEGERGVVWVGEGERGVVWVVWVGEREREGSCGLLREWADQLIINCSLSFVIC